MDNIQLNHSSHNASEEKFPLCLLVHDITSPENIGSIFRIADALGIVKIYLSGSSPLPPNPKIHKTSRSTEKYVPFEYAEDPHKIISKLKLDNYVIISLEITSSSVDIRTLELNKDQKICLILGSENAGVNQELLDVSNKTIHIPMHGQNSSMNVTAACGIACWEMIRRLGASQQTPLCLNKSS